MVEPATDLEIKIGGEKTEEKSSPKRDGIKNLICLTGVEGHLNDGNFIKILRKIFGESIPAQSVSKKRGKNFAFVLFRDDDEQSRFTEVVSVYEKNGKKWRVNIPHKGSNFKGFTKIVSRNE